MRFTVLTSVPFRKILLVLQPTPLLLIKMLARLLQIEAGLFILHGMATFVIFESIMLVTILCCRVPRFFASLMILIFLTKKDEE